jgi:hypothetical protein
VPWWHSSWQRHAATDDGRGERQQRGIGHCSATSRIGSHPNRRRAGHDRDHQVFWHSQLVTKYLDHEFTANISQNADENDAVENLRKQISSHSIRCTRRHTYIRSVLEMQLAHATVQQPAINQLRGYRSSPLVLLPLCVPGSTGSPSGRSSPQSAGNAASASRARTLPGVRMHRRNPAPVIQLMLQRQLQQRAA